MLKTHPLSPEERAELVKRIRFDIGVRRRRSVSLAEFAQMVSDVLELERPLSVNAAHGWERGAEPGFLAGCAIAHLGGLPAEALAFKQAGGASRPASEAYPLAEPTPLRQVAEKPSGFSAPKGRRITPAPAKRRGKRA